MLAGMKPMTVFGPSPLVSAVNTSVGTLGLCNKGTMLSSATVQVGWTFNYNGGTGAGYTLQVVRTGGGTVTHSRTMGATTYTDTINYVQNGAFNRFTSNYVYTVQLVRGDGVITSTAASSTWAVVYGTCS